MIWKKITFKSIIMVSIFGIYISIMPLSKPILKNGRYYSSEHDTHQHIDFWRAIRLVFGKLVSLQTWKNMMYGSTVQVPQAVGIPAPIQSIPPQESEAPVITWIGQATFLIQVGGLNIITDPIFGDIMVGPYYSLAKRTMKPGIALKDLPRIDAILISHNHSDHTDTHSLQTIQKKYDPTIFVPAGDKDLFKSMGFTKVVENTWWDARALTIDNKTVTFTFLPAYHWSIRFSLDSYRRSLWGGWMITHNDTNIYFAGDTAYGPFFKEIAQQFSSIDVALMPIGPSCQDCDKGNPHKEVHVDAKEAVQAFIDTKAKCFVPMHYGTFKGDEHFLYPIPQLNKYWARNQELLQGKRLLIAQCGKQYDDAVQKVSI